VSIQVVAGSGGSRAAAFDGTSEDQRLLGLLRRGDASAFETLVRLYGGRLLAVARRLLRNEEDARDAVQDAFLSAFRSIDGFEGQARISTWLHRIVVNAALMKIRSRQRKPEDTIEDLLPRFLDDGHPVEPAVLWRSTCQEAVERGETRALVRRCIDQLPETYRNVLMLRDIEEMDTQEAARLLGVTENAVKIRLHRARQALRALLDPHLREGAYDLPAAH
jgi:RNA polymerase sigma-70 factor, ECF subfamily